jgi:hypothetical protein
MESNKMLKIAMAYPEVVRSGKEITRGPRRREYKLAGSGVRETKNLQTA